MRGAYAMLLALSACGSSAPPAAAPAAADTRKLGADMQALVDRFIAADLADGVALAAVDGDHVIRIVRGVDDGARFEIGSTTKVFTALLLADAVARGEVKYSTTLAEVLPGFELSEAVRGVTLEQLASHRSGLPRLPPNLAVTDLENPYAGWDEKALRAALATQTLDKPGTYAYSNYGAGVLGWVLGRRAGKTYEDLIAERIARPLGLRGVTFGSAGLAQGHDSTGAPVDPWDAPVLAGAGMIRAPLDDMIAFLRAQLAPPDGPLGQAIRDTHARRGDAGGGIGIALGWHVGGPDAGTEAVLWHNGQTGGFHSFMAVDSKRRQAVVVLVDRAEPYGDALGGAALRVLRGEDPALDLPPAIDAADLDRVAGNYQLVPGIIIKITREEGRLIGEAAGQPRLRLYPETKLRWVVPMVDAKLEFAADGSTLTLHQGGQTVECRRIARE